VTPPLMRTLRDGDTPVVLVHPGAIAVGAYRGLADALPAGVGLVVVDLEQVPAYYGAALTGGRTDTSVEAIADVALDAALGAVWSFAAPWVLAGWSFGGVITHAMLDRLPAADRPERVVVIDALAPVPEYTADETDGLDRGVVLGWFAGYLGAKRGAVVAVDRDELAALPPDEGLAKVLDAGVAGGALRPGTPVAGLRKVFETYRDGLVRNNRLVRASTPTSTDVPLTLLRPERGLVTRPGALGWERLVSDPTVLTCPGDHYTTLASDRTAALFAATVAEALEQAPRPARIA
jgi:thioesterase domain-containing protein